MAEPAHSEPRSALFELTLARVRESLRDPTAVLWTFGFPIFLAVVLGLAFRTLPNAPEPVALVCGPPSDCHALRAQLAPAAHSIDVRAAPLAEALAELRRGKVALVAELSPGRADEPPELVLHLDPARKEARLARAAIEASLGARPSELQLRERVQSERGTRYIDFLMPGVIALNLMGSGVWGIGLSIVDQRKRKLMRRLATTPMKRSDFLLAYVLSRLVFLVPEVVLLLGFGVLAFDTPIRGDLLTVGLLSLVGALSFTAIGLWIGARVQSAEAAAGWANLVIFPMGLGSGVFFSYEVFPDALWPAIRALPLTALTDALRRVINDAAPLSACGVELAVMLAWTAVAFTASLKTFRWQ